ncbi:VanW family protein [Haloplasma contractile]|uniref:VanW like protein n=1 Tax=Haloplasma contractile SSD-17B TaxID=1033810 RepID=U2FS79_9MOLU|nr:VanW family protein [Haloplasma contractile]ERJ13804.1 VanW like protein [Haloplasma contractile SSD-17B]
MNNKKILPLIIIIFITVSITTGGLVYFAFNISNFTTYGMDTTIANVYIGGKNYNQSFTGIQNEIVNWKKNATVTLNYQDYEEPIDPMLFKFNVAESLDTVQNGRHNRLKVSLEDDVFNKMITDYANATDPQLLNTIDQQQLKEALLQDAADLKLEDAINIGDYINDYTTLAKDLNTVELSLTETEVKQLMATLRGHGLTKMEIRPTEQFSLLETYAIIPDGTTGDLDESTVQPVFSDEELSIIGTGLYSLILKTNFTNIDKHIGVTLPYYSQKGYEAKVSYYDEEDMTFYNPNPYSFYITIAEDSNKLIFTLSGPPFINSITIVTDVKIMEPKTIIREVKTLDPDRKRAIPGYEGYSILVKRIVSKHNDETYHNHSIEVINEDIYMPKETIIEIGINTES